MKTPPQFNASHSDDSKAKISSPSLARATSRLLVLAVQMRRQAVVRKGVGSSL